MNHRSLSTLFFLLVLALLVSACGGSQLTYRASGDAAEAHVTYVDADGNTQEQTVSLPWETSFGIGKKFDFKIGVENADEVGSVGCGVWINDRSAGETSGARRVECSGAFSGSKNSYSVDYRGRYDTPSGAAAGEAANALSVEPTPTQTPQPTPEATATPAQPVATIPALAEFERYEHAKDCLAYDKDLWLKAFSVLYPAGAAIQDCEENPENYVAFYFEPVGENKDAALLLGLGHMYIDTTDREAYPSTARRLFSTMLPQFEKQYEAQPIASDPILYQGETLVHYDFEAVIDGVPRLMRLAAIPNFEHGHGILFAAIQMILVPAQEAFPAFDDMTREIIASFEFAPEEEVEAPADDAQVEAAAFDLEPYQHNMDCLVYSDKLVLESFSILHPAGSRIIDCRENPQNYVIFEHIPDDDGNVPDFVVVLGNFHIDVAADDMKSDYMSDGDDLLDVLGPQLASQFKADMLADQPIMLQGIPYYRRDYVGEMWGGPALLRMVTIPNFEHGQGLLFLAISKIGDTPEADLPEFDALTQEIIGSVAWSAAEPETGDVASPEDVVQAVFDAAQSGDFAPLADLCDPQGENDDDTKVICSAATDDAHRQVITEAFVKSRINGETQVSEDGDQAQVPFLFGPDGDREETMVLIKRAGRWYLLGF